MENIFKDKTILITGGSGSIGSEIVRQLLKYDPKQVRVFSRNETRQYHLMEQLDYPENVRMLIGDIRDRDRLDLALRGVNIIFHAAALKHVPFCEYNPAEVIKTNIVGSQNVIDIGVRHGVEKIIAISTDKAANPHNVLGVSKLMMEKLFMSSNQFLWDKIKFSCVRFGNVAWADGSVLPMWKKQAERNGVINVTDGDATRFLMSMEQAVHLVLKAAELSQGGEIFVLKMPSVKLADLARIFIKKYFPKENLKIKKIGHRAGDKRHEYIMGENDLTARILVDKEMLILTPLIHIHHPKQEQPVYEGFKLVANPNKLKLSSKDNLRIKEIARMI